MCSRSIRSAVAAPSSNHLAAPRDECRQSRPCLAITRIGLVPPLPPLLYFLHLCRTVDSTSRLLESLVVMSRLNRSIFVCGVAKTTTRRLEGMRHPRRHGRLSQSRPADFANGFEGRAPGVNGTAHVLVPPLIGTPRAMLDEEIRAFD